MKKEEVRSPLIVELGNSVDQNIQSCFYRSQPGGFLGGCRVVRWCWVNFQCRGVLQFG